MSRFIIKGNKKLKGEIEVRGAKNAAFPLMAATLLTNQECVIKNLPLIEDVFRTIEILKSMGVKVEREGRALVINSSNFNPFKLKKNLIEKLRGSILFYGPLLAKFNEIKLPRPGGCLIGARPIDTHLDAFSQLGISIKQENNFYKLKKEKAPKKREVVLKEFSVTATENVLLFSSLIPKEIIIRGADLDYQVQELIKFLRKMGVEIKKGHRTITIKGKEGLKGATHKLVYDPIEAGTFILTAVATKSNLIVRNVEFSFLRLFLKKLRESGVKFKVLDGGLEILPWKKLKIDKVQSLPYPGLHTDLQSAWAVVATQSEGSTLIHDPLYEGRFKYLEELNRMGAKIYFADPHRVIVEGPTPLYGKDLGSFDLRGGAALIIASLVAKGKSTIEDTYQIDRGYEKIEERLQKIGASIKRV